MDTSAETTKSEVRRFLQGNEPAVLCVTGEWGVGKTFLWRSVLDELRQSRGLGLTRYSYVSLFGLNSLDDVKASLFENMEWLDEKPTNYIQQGKAGIKALTARTKKLSELAGGLPWVGQTFTKARSLFFSLIQSQVVCIDDLDRRSKNLDIRDILGLVSFLSEHRKCKVALLLNEEALEDGHRDYESLLEKVVDIKTVLLPTPAESAMIALPEHDTISVALRAHCEALGLRNIRIIKQIERLARRADEVLTEFSQPIRDQATHSIALFAWSKYDKNNAPKPEFLKVSSLERHLSRSETNKPIPDEEAAWESLLCKYRFEHCDDLDISLLKYVQATTLNVDEIKAQARAQQERLRLGELEGSLRAAWRLFHNSFDDDEDQVVGEILSSMKKSSEIVSLSDLNTATILLRELGRKNETKDLLDFFEEKKSSDFWDAKNNPLPLPLDPNIIAIVEKREAAEATSLDVQAALIRSGKDYDEETIRKLAAVSTDTFYDLIYSLRGDEKEDVILSALTFRRMTNATDDMKTVVNSMEKALRRIGKISRLNAMRIKKYGVSIDN